MEGWLAAGPRVGVQGQQTRPADKTADGLLVGSGHTGMVWGDVGQWFGGGLAVEWTIGLLDG